MTRTTPPTPGPGPGSAEDLRARIAAHLAGPAGAHRRVHEGDDWLYLHDPGMPHLPHGWKLHVSTRPDRLPELLDLVVPVLLRHTCDAKFAAGVPALRALNSGLRGPAGVGKAVTVYPAPDAIGPLAAELAELLAGHPGPRVVSDRRLRADAPVYYRYGPFRIGTADRDLVMTGPAGESFPGLAEGAYRQPPWAVDPFAARAPRRTATTRIGDGRYRITAGITRSPVGHVYRAVELATGRELVVKQARAFVAEDPSGIDARGRLRHERRVLAALAGVPGVPHLVDYFRHGEDEYLVSTARGPRDLRRTVLADGPYDTSAAPGSRGGNASVGNGNNGNGNSGTGTGRDWWALARGLLAVLDTVHARGVVVCDLKPANVVIDTSGDCSLVDFGVSALAGERPEGATRGYGLPGTTDAHPADDYYSLGATLHYAATGLDPVVIDPDPVTNRARTLAGLAGVLTGHRASTAAAVALVAGLLSLDAGERTATAADLRRGTAVRPAAATLRPPEATGDRLAGLVDHTLTRCVRMAHDLVNAATGRGKPRALLSYYDGAAGLGLELLQHPDRPDARAAATALARWTATHPALDRLGPGLYDGRAGVDLFLAQAAHLLGTEPPATRFPLSGDLSGDTPQTDTPPTDHPHGAGPSADASHADQISGAAGLGTAHLLLARLARADGRPEEAERHLAAAAACARRLTDGHPTDPRETPGPGTAALIEGFAHGRAGLAHFLLALPDGHAGDATAAATRRLVDGLAAELPRLAAAAAHPGATRRYGSWCRGLAGLGTTLLQAGRHYGEEVFTARADEAAAACRALAPRMGMTGQCCGLAGVGELLVDLAVATGEERHWHAAEEVAGLILSRAGGPPGRPLLPGNDPAAESAAWAVGTPGVLGFLRRLHRRGGPRPALLFPN
ncbi:class IV lanthionine synthetase LanL [Kitasatospora sp. NPDC093806]|uniref:class IV lanthionine synthetase LanL n=1 Tax=Kitasatospora sp. NPDC093806 TaxID=3155075 RepID=UPI003444DAFB